MQTGSIKRAVALGIAAIGYCQVAQSVTSAEELGRIRSAAERFALQHAEGLAPLDADVKVTAGRLDSRLRLEACSHEPEAFMAPGQHGIPSSVGVRCTGESSWTLYVPVRVEVLTDVLVLTVPAERGEHLTANHVRVEKRDVAGITQSYLTDLDAIAGMVMRRRALAGTVLNGAVLERETIVERGERVRLEAGGGALSVSVEGEAMADAARGDRVRVKNIASGVVVEGTASEPGLVVLDR